MKKMSRRKVMEIVTPSLGLLLADGTLMAQVRTNQAEQRIASTAQLSKGRYVRRPWSVSNVMVKYLALEPAKGEGVIGLTLVGEDGERYLLDDVVYGILQLLEKHFRAK